MPKSAKPRGETARPSPTEPRGELQIRTIAMPADTNQAGDIFGGWVLGQMDIAGGIFSAVVAKGRVATVAVDAMVFKKPVYVGDVVCVYCQLERIGRSSIAVRVEAWALRRYVGNRILVTEGIFTYVALDDEGRPRPVPQPK